MSNKRKQVFIEFDDIILKFQADDKDNSYPKFRIKIWSKEGIITYDNTLHSMKEHITRLRNFFNSIELPEEE